MGVTGWRTTLAWTQFRTVQNAPAGVNEDAQTEAAIEAPAQVSIQPDGSQLKLANFNVRVRIVPIGTWVVRGKSSASLLTHEQGHWDIAGLSAHEYHRALAALRAADRDSLAQQAADALQSNQTKVDALQVKYDRETNNSRNASEQTRWNNLISACIRNNNAALPDP